jgi:hypothetical protein
MVETGATRRAEEKGYYSIRISFLFPVAVKSLATIICLGVGWLSVILEERSLAIAFTA